MATKKHAPATGQRRCIGSERYGIKAHDAPIADFPAQPSQTHGLGRMCKTHWNQYTAGLARDRKAKLAGAEPPKTAVATNRAPRLRATVASVDAKAADRTAAALLRQQVRAQKAEAKPCSEARADPDEGATTSPADVVRREDRPVDGRSHSRPRGERRLEPSLAAHRAPGATPGPFFVEWRWCALA